MFEQGVTVLLVQQLSMISSIELLTKNLVKHGNARMAGLPAASGGTSGL
jgi:hypothetical protein